MIPTTTLNRGNLKTDTPYLTHLGIPTRNRTASLEHVLLSVRPHVKDRPIQITVADDSRDSQAVRQNRHRIRHIADQQALDIRHLTRTGRKKNAEAWAHACNIDPETMRAALLGLPFCPQTYGATRNSLLLASRGHLSLQSDDDVLLALGQLPEVQDQPALTSTNPIQNWYFTNQADAERAIHTVQKNVFQLHEQGLGKSVEAYVQTTAEHQTPFPNQAAHIRLSILGTAGDSGIQNPISRLFSEGPSFDRLTAQPECYRQYLNTRSVVRSVLQPTFSNHPFIMSPHLGIDGRGLVPPFSPIGRGEDGVFGSLFYACFKDFMALHHPVVCLHRPPEIRTVPHETNLAGMFPVRANDLLMMMILSEQSHLNALNPAQNLMQLGQTLTDWSEESMDIFCERIRHLCLYAYTLLQKRIHARLLETHAEPPYWSQDLIRYLQHCQLQIETPYFFVPHDLPGDHIQQLKWLKVVIKRFGQILYAWPQIYQQTSAHLEAYGVQA